MIFTVDCLSICCTVHVRAHVCVYVRALARIPDIQMTSRCPVTIKTTGWQQSVVVVVRKHVHDEFCWWWPSAECHISASLLRLPALCVIFKRRRTFLWLVDQPPKVGDSNVSITWTGENMRQVEFSIQCTVCSSVVLLTILVSGHTIFNHTEVH